MTAPTQEQINAIIEATYVRPMAFSSPRNELENAMSALASWVTDPAGGWERWPCEDSDCPARPLWDAELSYIYGRFLNRLDDFGATMKRKLAKDLISLAERYPDVPWHDPSVESEEPGA